MVSRPRWTRTVDLVESVLRIRDAKSDRGLRAIAIAPTLAEMLWQHHPQTAFQGDGRLRVYPRQNIGTPLVVDTYVESWLPGGAHGRWDRRPRPPVPRPTARVSGERRGGGGDTSR